MVWWEWLGLAWLGLGIGLLMIAEISARRADLTLFCRADDWPVSLGAALMVILGAPFAALYLLYCCSSIRLPRRLLLWLRIEPPPFVGTRCGTPLIGATAARRRATLAAWEAHELTYINWVKAHPRPKPEWVKRMRRLIEMREGP
jgi:hypothetical protein